MLGLLYIIFWGAFFFMFHTYLLYPFILKVRAGSKETNRLHYKADEEWPQVSVLMAAYNEEQVIEAKIESLLAQDYPASKFKIYIGSDNSTDATNTILAKFSSERLIPTYFTTRQGKPMIINQLVAQALAKTPAGSAHLLLMTDASVMLSTDVIMHLVKHFKNPEIGLVDAHMTYTGMTEEGISKSENTYLSREVTMKQNESKLWGQMIGPFGGCFALRSDLYEEVPGNSLVDDFYLAMQVLDKDKKVINEMAAICHEPVSHKSSEEFRRKKRISTGNFQNLFRFKHLLNPFSSLGFAFGSHKVLRWLGPFWMLLMLVTALVLAIKGSSFFQLIALLQLVWYIVIPLADKLLSAVGLNIALLRNISYFNKMNWALMRGFMSYIGGVESSIWEPTQRV